MSASDATLTPWCPTRRRSLGRPVPAWSAVKAAFAERPELAAGRADIARANADVLAMRDMYKPMAWFAPVLPTR